MSENCNHDCGSCEHECGENKSFIEKQNEFSHVKKVVGIVSGKGGVGKSLVSSLLAVAKRREGYNVAILDADVTGPSIPKAFGITEKAVSPDGKYLSPCVSKSGIKVMSLNLLLPSDTDPVVWRGPVIAGTVKQFWTDVNWGDVDYMFVDMPPGTGDVPLTVFQTMPLCGIVIVASPQELVSMIVKKAVKMAELMKIPVLGLVENMSYLVCPDCGKKISVFGESKGASVAKEFGISKTAFMPLSAEYAALCDAGKIETVGDELIKPLKDIYTAI